MQRYIAAVPTTRPDLLIVAAFAPELAGLRHLLDAELRGTIGASAVACALIGVGIPNAAASTVATLSKNRPRALVLVGTAGVYALAAPSLVIGDAVVVRRAVLVDAAEVDGHGVMPVSIGRAHACAESLGRAIAGPIGPQYDAATTLGVTTDDAFADRIAAASGCALENLEVFAVANACALIGVPFAAVLGISNRVGSCGRDEWRQHHLRAGLAACALVERWLTDGAGA